jgi:hypothetical protein
MKDTPFEAVGTGLSPHAGRRLLWIGFGVVIFCILMTRIPFFTPYFLPGIFPDTWSFLLPVVDMHSGHRPAFVVRLPGYPIFVLLATSLHQAWEPLLAAQTAASLGAGCLMVYAAHRACCWLALPAAIAIVLALSSGIHLAFETSVLSESLYVCTLISGFACLLIGLREQRTGWLAATSLFFAYAIWIRPAGLFLVVIVVATWLFMLWNRYCKRAQLALWSPMVVLLLILATYNSVTLGIFALSPVGSRNIAAATAMFWEQDPGFSTDTNAAIQRMQGRVSAKDWSVLSESWDLELLHDVFRTNYGYTEHVRKFAFAQWFEKRQESMATYREFFEILPRVAGKAVRSHPQIYLKFVISNLYAYYWKHPVMVRDFWGQSLPRRLEMWKTGPLANEEFIVQFIDFRSSRRWREQRIGEETVQGYTLRPSMGLVFVTYVAKVHTAISSTRVWVLMYILVFLASLARVVWTRARDPNSCFVLLLCAAGLGAALLVSLVEVALLRYSYPTTFILYLSVAFSPLLFSTPVSKSS